MSEKVSNKLNIVLPHDVANQLERLAKRTGSTKKELAVNALRQYIAVKNRELDFYDEDPNVNVSSEAVIKAWQERKPKNVASVMIY